MGVNKEFDKDSESAGIKSSACPTTTTGKDNSVCNNCVTSSTSSTVNSTTCLTNPPNIHINHMYVYNFSPDKRNSSAFDTPPIRQSKYQSPAASSGPICRICFEGDSKEDLVSPCRCTGSVGVVHKGCMERWLSTTCNLIDKCEICNYAFVTARSPKSVIDWFRSEENDGNHRRSLVGDMTCFLLLTPLAVVSSYLCVEGAKKQVVWGNSLEAGCLMALATFLVTIYFLWNVLTLSQLALWKPKRLITEWSDLTDLTLQMYHLKNYLRWSSKNQNVKLLRVQRVSTAVESSTNNLQILQVVPQVYESNRSPSATIMISDSEINRIPARLPTSV